MHNVYYFGPFRFESELEIPELRDSRGSAERLVQIQLGAVQPVLEGAISADSFVQVAPREYLLNIPEVARYHVCNGRSIRVEIVPGAPAANVSLYLLGSVFGALCHQNGLLPLHASAIASGEAVTAFLGDSGAGKSTLAACLRGRGHTIVADDICLLDPTDPTNPRVIPVAGWLKLWNQSLEHLGHTAIEEHRVFSTDDKYRVFLPSTSEATRRLSRLVFLQRAESEDAEPALTPLSIAEAVAAMMDMTYAVYIPVLTGQQQRVFRQCAAVLRHAQPYRLTRPWSLDRTDDVLDLLERELLGPDKQHR
jgi:hypothetical protein